MSNATNRIKKRWIPIVAVLTIMVGASSFAIVPNTGQPTVDELAKKSILLGSAGTSTGSTVITTNTYMWTEDCQLSQNPVVFTVAQFECTKHTAVMKITGTKGDRTEFTIDSLRCLASTDDQVAIVRGNVGTGLLVDIIDATDIFNVKLTTRPNEWIVQVHNCDTDTTVAAGENEYKFDLVLLDSGTFEFDLSLEEIV
jgi:hypothetical protein